MAWRPSWMPPCASSGDERRVRVAYAACASSAVEAVKAFRIASPGDSLVTEGESHALRQVTGARIQIESCMHAPRGQDLRCWDSMVVSERRPAQQLRATRRAGSRALHSVIAVHAVRTRRVQVHAFLARRADTPSLSLMEPPRPTTAAPGLHLRRTASGTGSTPTERQATRASL